MKTVQLLISITFLLVLGCSKDSDPGNNGTAKSVIEWVKQAGSSNSDYGHIVKTDGQGNIYIVGCFTGTSTFGSYTLSSVGENNIFIAKMDAGGEFKWAKKCGGNSLFTDQERLNSMALDAEGNLYVCGTFTGICYFDTFSLQTTNNDIFVAKLNPMGDFIWVKQAGGPGNGDFAFSIAVDPQGYIFLAGAFYQTASFGNQTLTGPEPGKYSFIAKMDHSGNFTWAKQAGESTLSYITSVAADDQGNSYITGKFYGTAVFGAITVSVNNQNADLYVAKLDPTGKFLWVKSTSGNNSEQSNAITLDNQNNIYLTGTFIDKADFGTDSLITTGTDAFFAKMSPEGNWLWAKQSKTKKTIPENTSCGLSISTDNEGSVYATGYLMGETMFGSDTIVSNGHANAFIIKLDSQGNYIWVNHSATKANAGGSCIVPDNQGNCYVTGYFSNITTFGDITLPWSGSVDVFVAKLK